MSNRHKSKFAFLFAALILIVVLFHNTPQKNLLFGETLCVEPVSSMHGDIKKVDSFLDIYLEIMKNLYKDKKYTLGWTDDFEYHDLVSSISELKLKLEDLIQVLDKDTNEGMEIALESIKLLGDELVYKQKHISLDLWGILGDFKSKVYADSNSGMPKCNLFVSEVIYSSFCLIHKGKLDIFQKEFPYVNNVPWKWSPPLADEWSNVEVEIERFKVRYKSKNRQIGDIWSHKEHVGVYLGDFYGKRLYISARELGIEIKFIPNNEEGVYRYYVAPVKK
ncbi:hypothetical protein NDA01_27750 [Trichocoleus desertorum AS-A10]|uniref:hypothetical protein n=1 Tax=Trichocoleus desertorum TaxID=1481672 RepID=UPI0032989CF0